eukprot:g49318.t1
MCNTQDIPIVVEVRTGHYKSTGVDGVGDKLLLFGVDGVEVFDLKSTFYTEGSGHDQLELSPTRAPQGPEPYTRHTFNSKEEMTRAAESYDEPLESDIPPVLAFMVSKKCVLCVPRGVKMSIISFDIECYTSLPGAFPNSTRETDAVRKVAFHLGKCEQSTEGAVESKNEHDLLLQWQTFVQANDPDVLLSYNGHNFDEKYLSDRGGKTFGFLSRLKGYRSFINKDRPCRWRYVPGRIDLDLYAYVKNSQLKYRDYKLDTVAKHILKGGAGKTGLSIADMFKLYEENRMAKVVEYCMQDCQLVLQLYDALGVEAADNALAEVTHVFRQDLHTRGISFRVLSHFYAEAKHRGMIMARSKPGDKLTGDSKYEGAYVMEPKRIGLIEHVITLDFASLYPSMMIAHNICSSTLIEEGQTRDPNGLYLDLDLPSGRKACFRQDKPGLVPTIVKNLLDARTRTKKQMKESKDELEKVLLNARQMAEKVCANSAYGFFGLKTSMYGMVVVAEAITYLGQKTIKKAIEIAESSFQGLEVIYTDTDSLFCHFKNRPPSRHGLFDLGQKVADKVNIQLPPPISLEVEKTLEPFLISSKKMYAGWMYDRPSDDSKKLLVKGLRATRRDGALYFDRLYSELLELMLNMQPASACRAIIKERLDKMLHAPNVLNYSDFVLTTTLGESYKEPNKSPAVIVARQMAPSPLPGDRVSYVLKKTGRVTPPKKFEQVLEASRGSVQCLDLAAYTRASKQSFISLLSLVKEETEDPLHAMFDNYITRLAPRSAGIKDIRSFFN